MVLGIKSIMIQKKTYDDLRLLLDTLEGLPYESQKDIAYVDAVRLIVDKYEEETMRRKSPHELTKNNPVAKNARKVNKSMIHSDQYKESKKGYIKHKGRKTDKDV